VAVTKAWRVECILGRGKFGEVQLQIQDRDGDLRTVMVVHLHRHGTCGTECMIAVESKPSNAIVYFVGAQFVVTQMADPYIKYITRSLLSARSTSRSPYRSDLRIPYQSRKASRQDLRNTQYVDIEIPQKNRVPMQAQSGS
jgi:hypothetical protein